MKEEKGAGDPSISLSVRKTALLCASFSHPAFPVINESAFGRRVLAGMGPLVKRSIQNVKVVLSAPNQS